MTTPTIATRTPRRPVGPCPSWCRLPEGHGWDSQYDEWFSRCHSGPKFGELVSVGSTEYDDGNIEYHVDFAEQTMLENMTAGELRDFALDVLRAADALERLNAGGAPTMQDAERNAFEIGRDVGRA